MQNTMNDSLNTVNTYYNKLLLLMLFGLQRYVFYTITPSWMREMWLSDIKNVHFVGKE